MPYNRWIGWLAILINTQLAYATPQTNDDTYWQCTVSDSESNQWTAKGLYERTATNAAFDACKKQSRVPTHCAAAKEACESFIHGVTTRPMWVCTALDHQAQAWASNVYTHQDDAALAAKAYCAEQSREPMSCYVNMITCKNINNHS